MMTTDWMTRKRPVPMKRAMRSEKRPNASGSGDGQDASDRAPAAGRAGAGGGQRAPRSATPLCSAARSVDGIEVVLAPVVRQQVVEHVVDGHGAEQASAVIDDRRRDQVVGREVGG